MSFKLISHSLFSEQSAINCRVHRKHYLRRLSKMLVSSSLSSLLSSPVTASPLLLLQRTFSEKSQKKSAINCSSSCSSTSENILHNSCEAPSASHTSHESKVTNVKEATHSQQKGNAVKCMKPSECLEKYVNRCVAAKDVINSTQAILAGIHGYVPPINVKLPSLDAKIKGKNSIALEQERPEWQQVPGKVFSWRALSSVLYICECRKEEQQGLDLVNKLREVYPELVWNDESVLSVILRLQCSVHDVAGATRLFHYLVQNKLLKLRTASTFLHFACHRIDRQTAFGVYNVCLQEHIELEEDDYYALCKLCVQVAEPISTLHFILREMSEHISSVSEKFAKDVLAVWWRQCDNINNVKRECDCFAVSNKKQISCEEENVHTGRTHVCADGITDTAKNKADVDRDKREKESDGTVNVNVNVNVHHTMTDCCCCCPICNTKLKGYAFTREHRNQLLTDLTDVIIPQKCNSQRARAGFEHWKRYISQRTESDPINLLIDGANIGYYGLSKWYADAKTAILLRKYGERKENIPPEEIDFTLQCKKSTHGVDVGVNFKLINDAVQMAITTFHLDRPLVVLHERHCEPQNVVTEEDANIIKEWRAKNLLYCTPTGLNDDLCWLYAALTLTHPDELHPSISNVHTDHTIRCIDNECNQHNNINTSGCSNAVNVKPTIAAIVNHCASTSVLSSSSTTQDVSDITATACDYDNNDNNTYSIDKQRLYVLTNDLMRDHHFKLFSPRSFVRWRDRHTINFSCVRENDATLLRWHWPSNFTRCIQEHSDACWHIPYDVEFDKKEDGIIVTEDSAEKVGSECMKGHNCTTSTTLQKIEKREVQQIVEQVNWLCLHKDFYLLAKKVNNNYFDYL